MEEEAALNERSEEALSKARQKKGLTTLHWKCSSCPASIEEDSIRDHRTGARLSWKRFIPPGMSTADETWFKDLCVSDIR